MKRLLLLLAALVLAPAASAQWSFDGNFPDDETAATPHIHGIGVTPDGNVWTQSYYPFAGDSVAVTPFPTGDTADCNETTGNCRVVSLRIYQPDGSQASFSPIVTVTLPGGEADTLGGELGRNSAGALNWDYNSGRGLRVGGDGNVYAAFFNTLYKFDADGNVLDVLNPSMLDTRGVAGPAVDEMGNVYLTGVFPGDPVAKFDQNLDFVENVQNPSQGFNRTMFAMPDGNTVIVPNYSSQVATILTRPDDLTPYDSVGVTFTGMAVESITIHPTTGNIWVRPAARTTSPRRAVAPAADVVRVHGRGRPLRTRSRPRSTTSMEQPG